MKRFATKAICILFALFMTSGLAIAQDQLMDRGDLSSGISKSQPASMLKGGPSTVLAQWSTGTNMPESKRAHTIASYNGFVYAFAGASGNQWSTTVYKYEIATDTWTKLKNFPEPKWLDGHAETVGDKIYLFSAVENWGSNYKVVTNVYEYDPAADTYTKKANLPTPQALCGSAVINGRVYLIAGNSSTQSLFTNQVQVFDPFLNNWSMATPYPRDVAFTGAIGVGDKIVVTGGFNANYTPSRYVADTYVGFDNGGTLNWVQASDYPFGPIIFPVAAGTTDKAVFFGGWPADDNNQPYTRRSYMYDPAGDQWTALELKPTGVQGMLRGGSDGSMIISAGGEITGSASSVAVEILNPTVEGDAVAQFSKTDFDEWVKIGTQPAFPMTLSNLGVKDLNWSAAIDGDVPWLMLSKESGTITPMQNEVIGFGVNAVGLPEGIHRATIKFTTNDPSKPEVEVGFVIHAQVQDIYTQLNVLVEQYTGAWCVWCPYGADSLKMIVDTFGDRVVRTSWHDSQASFPDAMEIAEWTDMANFIGVGSFPSASVNRLDWTGTGEIPLDRSDWGNAVRYLLDNSASPVTLTIEDKTYDPATKQLSFKAHAFFHRGMKGDLRLNAVLTEDNINHRQAKYLPATGQSVILDPYYHFAVVRGIYPNILGEPLTGDQNIDTQTEIVKDFTMTVPVVDASQGKIVIYVHQLFNGQVGPVYQAHSEKMTTSTAIGGVPTAEAFSLHQNYPNPFNPSTTIVYDVPKAGNVNLTLFDSFGREIGSLAEGMHEAGSHQVVLDGGNLASGTYFVTMRAGSFVQTRTITLMK